MQIVGFLTRWLICCQITYSLMADLLKTLGFVSYVSKVLLMLYSLPQFYNSESNNILIKTLLVFFVSPVTSSQILIVGVCYN